MHPILIAGAALVGLPIVLHLILKQEPKRLVFPAVRFLKLKQKTSERKMRLRHLLLLALRCLLIALFALTLFQPRANTAGALNLSGEEPVAAVFVIDLSPSMGYRGGAVSRLDEARRRALDLLDQLPPSSRVAVLDPNDPGVTWEPTLLDARRRIEGLKEPAGSAPPITTTLATAYQLLRTVDQEIGEGTEPLPRLVAVFGDRAADSWDSARVEELKSLRDAVPKPAPVHLFFDVGVNDPANVAIVSAEMRPQRLSGSADAVLNVVLRADGSDVPSGEVTAQLDNGPVQRAEVALTTGSPKGVPFRFTDLSTGFHTVSVSIRDDNLGFDNSRFVTFEVAPRRKILTISDDPRTAEAWELSHNFGKQEFDCTVVTPDAVPDLAGYEAVTLLGVRAPPEDLGKKLLEYVETGGGKLVLMPDGPDSTNDRKDAYNETLSALLPAQLGDIREWPLRTDPKRPLGVPWNLDDDRDLAHPLLAPLREFKRQGNVDIFDPQRRRVATRYRLSSQPGANAAVVAYYDDADDPSARTPALIERAVGAGRVLLLTTRFDFPASAEGPGFWNDYAKLDHSWATVLPWMLMRYLCGSPEDAAYNFPAGQDVTVPLPRFPAGAPRTVLVEGPGIAPRDAVVELGERQTELRLTPPKTLAPGTYTVRTPDDADPWVYQFSLFTPPAESVLSKVPEDAITALFGPDGVAEVDRDVKFDELITSRIDRPVELFPYLIALVLLFFALEGLVANRFYRLKL